MAWTLPPCRLAGDNLQIGRPVARLEGAYAAALDEGVLVGLPGRNVAPRSLPFASQQSREPGAGGCELGLADGEHEGESAAAQQQEQQWGQGVFAGWLATHHAYPLATTILVSRSRGAGRSLRSGEPAAGCAGEYASESEFGEV